MKIISDLSSIIHRLDGFFGGGGGHKRKGTDVWKGTLINYLIRSWHDLLSQPKTHVVERVFVIGFHVVFVSRI